MMNLYNNEKKKSNCQKFYAFIISMNLYFRQNNTMIVKDGKNKKFANFFSDYNY